MKKTIKALKHYLGLKSDKALAEFFGFTENTITRAKAGHNTKLNVVLPQIEWWFDNSMPWQHKAFIEKFKHDGD